MQPSPSATPSPTSVPALRVQAVEKYYGSRDNVTRALDGISLDVARGEFVAVMGPSGSGKTTLLNCVSTIDRPSAGRILVDGQDVCELRRGELARFRRERLGFIFQDSNLLDTLNGYENIALALTIKHESPSSIPARIEAIAKSLGVEGVLKKYPYQMSGGQKQRIAAARAIVADPKLILADEPTGALDSRSAQIMLETLDMMNTQMNATIMMVTHDAFAASFTNRVLFIKDGVLFNEIRRGDTTREDFFTRIMEVIAFLGGDASHAA